MRTRKMLRLLAIAMVGLTMSLGAFAHAADMAAPGPAYVKAPVAVPYSWSGFYLGGHLGYSWGHSGLTGSTCNPTISTTCSYNVDFANGISAALPGGVSPNSVLGGVQAGYNFQWQSLVFGVEADYSFLNAKGTRNVRIVVDGEPAMPLTQTVEDDWLSTVRGRLGFVPINNFLLFGTGGAAFGKVKYSTNLDQTPVDSLGSNQVGSVSTTKTGYVVGGGLEYALDSHWDLRAEYLYVNLGHVSVATANPAIAGETTTQSASFSMNIVRTGIDYKF